jgi:SAM-dependent methyltransferase
MDQTCPRIWRADSCGPVGWFRNWACDSQGSARGNFFPQTLLDHFVSRLLKDGVLMNGAETWARDFYAGVFVDLWLQATTEDQTRKEIDFLEKVLALPAGGAVVDLACGGGRHCLELAKRGYRPTGVDISTPFLDAARAAAACRGLAVDWQQLPIQ